MILFTFHGLNCLFVYSGGLLGLCMGFSLISAAEILFHCFFGFYSAVFPSEKKKLRLKTKTVPPGSAFEVNNSSQLSQHQQQPMGSGELREQEPIMCPHYTNASVKLANQQRQQQQQQQHQGITSPSSEDELSQQSYNQCYQTSADVVKAQQSLLVNRQKAPENATYEAAIRCGNKNCSSLQHVVHLQVKPFDFWRQKSTMSQLLVYIFPGRKYA